MNNRTPVWKTLIQLGLFLVAYALAFLPLKHAFWGMTEFAVGFYTGILMVIAGIYLGFLNVTARRDAKKAKDAAERAPAQAVAEGQPLA